MTRVAPLHTRFGMEAAHLAAIEAGHISFERKGALGLVTLSRPEALNAVTHGMVLALSAKLQDWAADDAVSCVAVRATGRAFSAGGDIRAIYGRGMAGNPFDAFFSDEYALNVAIHDFPKPYVSLVNGAAMGGGVGVGYHGSHVVVGERAVFAMPECGIGFFPDVGGTYLLGNLLGPSRGHVGTVLGLTGQRLGPIDQVRTGCATAHVSSEFFDALIFALADGRDPDSVIADLAETVPWSEADWSADAARLVAGVEGRTPLPDVLAEKCPTSLAVTVRQLAWGEGETFDRCIALEARIAYRMLREPDFYEGIRAAVIDKDGDPRWSASSVDDVSSDVVARFFDPVPDGPLMSVDMDLG